MRGKVCMITGSNTGIGEATALGLAKLGATIILVCRDREKGAAAAAKISRRASNPAVALMVADLSSQSQIRRLAEDFHEGRGGAVPTSGARLRLDVLIHNAGVILPQRRLTADGIEAQLAVNHLAPFLLTHLLLDMLLASAPARIVVVASQVHSQGTIHFDDLQSAKSYAPQTAYFQSKLANVLFTYELARRLQGTGVTVNCLHPGVIATNLLSDYMAKPRAMGFLSRLSHPGPEKGARPSVRLASDPTLETTTGKYFKQLVEAPTSKASYDLETARKLWKASEELTGLSPS